MADNEGQGKARKKNRPRYIVRAALFWGIAAFVLSIAKAVSFYKFIHSGGQNEVAGESCAYLTMGFFLAGGIGLLLALVCIAIWPFSDRRSINLYGGLIGLALCISAWTIENYSNFGFSFDRNRLDGMRYYARSKIRVMNIAFLSGIITEHAEKNEGRLPTEADWSDTLADNGSYGRLGLAVNSNLAGATLKSLSDDVVLIFEVNYGMDGTPLGSSELITAKNHYGLGCLVMFGDMRIEFVKAEDFKNLRWQNDQ